jgi:hypothetical protein
MPMPTPTPDPAKADRAVREAIQSLMAARLGRGFVPLAILFATGAVGTLRGTFSGMPLALGAIAASAAMLAYGLRIVQRALSRPHRAWMSMAMVGSIAPPAFALYVLGWLGLKGLAAVESAQGFGLAILYIGMGVWVLRRWMAVVEIERLAEVMMLDSHGGGGSA